MSGRRILPGTQGEDAFLVVDGVRIRFRDEGRGPAVLWLHGWTFDLQMWDQQALFLRDSFRIVRFDRRGHGLSGGHPNSEQDAGDVAALCAHLDLREIGLVGMSQGARGALRFAGQHPDRVKALILDGPPNLNPAMADEEVPMGHFRALVRTAGIEAFRQAWASHPLVQLCTEDARLQAQVHAMIATYPARELHETPGSTASHALSLDEVQAPTLVLNGAYDLPSRLESAQHLCSKLPHAQHQVLPDAGHLINLDQPALYSKTCRSFLNQHMGAGTITD